MVQPSQTRPLDAVAFKNDRGLIIAVHAVSLHYRVSKWQRAVYAGHTVMKHNIRLFAHSAQNLAAGERGTNGVPIRARVRGKQELIPLADVF